MYIMWSIGLYVSDVVTVVDDQAHSSVRVQRMMEPLEHSPINDATPKTSLSWTNHALFKHAALNHPPCKEILCHAKA